MNKYIKVALISVRDPSINDIRRPLVSAIMPVGISNKTSPTEIDNSRFAPFFYYRAKYILLVRASSVT